MFHAFTFFHSGNLDWGEVNLDNLVCPVIHVYNDLINTVQTFFFVSLSVKLVSLLWAWKDKGNKGVVLQFGHVMQKKDKIYHIPKASFSETDFGSDLKVNTRKHLIKYKYSERVYILQYVTMWKPHGSFHFYFDCKFNCFFVFFCSLKKHRLISPLFLFSSVVWTDLRNFLKINTAWGSIVINYFIYLCEMY